MRTTACLLLILMAGCGGVGASDVTVGRASVNEVFSRCRVFGWSDAEIDSFLILLAAARDDGFPVGEAFGSSLRACDDDTRDGNRDPERAGDCAVCVTTAVGYVYR